MENTLTQVRKQSKVTEFSSYNEVPHSLGQVKNSVKGIVYEPGSNLAGKDILIIIQNYELCHSFSLQQGGNKLESTVKLDLFICFFKKFVLSLSVVNNSK